MTKKIESKQRIFLLILSVVTGQLILGTVSSKKAPIMAVEIFRHGARSGSPNSIAPEDFEMLGDRNLLINGMREHYVLGSRMRSRYKDTLFAGTYNWNTSIVFTSDT